MLVLEEEHGVIAPYRRAQESVGIERGGRTDHPQPRAMREDRSASLGVINRAPDVTAVGRSHDHRRREIVVGPPAHRRKLVAQLHVRGPNVVEKLNLNYGLESAHGQSDRAAHDVRFRERRVVNARTAEFLLESPGDREDPALAFDLFEVLLSRDISYILAEDENLLVASHLVPHAGVEQIDHRRRLTRELRIVLGVELLAGGIDVGRVDAEVDRFRARLRLSESVVSRGENNRIHFVPNLLQVFFSRVALTDEPLRELLHRIARGISVALGGWAVLRFVIRQGMRVGTNHVSVHERRPFSLPRVVDGALHGVVAGEQIAAVHLFDQEIGKGANQLGNAAAGGIHFDRNRDGITVILDQIDDGKLQIRCGVQGFPEFAFTGRTLARRDEDHLVFLESFPDIEQLRAERSLRGPDSLEKLRACR